MASLLLLLAGVLLGLAAGASATDIAGDLVVAGTDARNNETVNISGSIIVPVGATLQWSDVNLTFTNASPAGAGLYIDGTATMFRVSVARESGAPYYLFLINSTASANLNGCDISGTAGQAGDPGVSTSTATTSFASLTGGIQIASGSVHIGNSTIHGGQGTLITVTAASPRLDSNHLDAPRYIGTAYAQSQVATTATSSWRVLAACAVVFSGSPDFDSNRLTNCGSDATTNFTWLGTGGANAAVSSVYVVAGGTVVLGGTPRFRLEQTVGVGQVLTTSRSYADSGVNVTQNIYPLRAWGTLLKNARGLTVSGGYTTSAAVGLEIYADSSFSGTAPTYSVTAHWVNGTFQDGIRVDLSVLTVAPSVILDGVTVYNGTGTAAWVKVSGISAASSVTVTGSSIFQMGTGRGLYIEASSMVGKPSIFVSGNSFTQANAPLTVALLSLTGGAAIDINNNSLNNTAGEQNFSCCSGDLSTRGGIDVHALSLTGGSLSVAFSDNRVYNQSYLIASTPFPGITYFNDQASGVQTTLTLRRNDISNVSYGVNLFEDYGAFAQNTVLVVTDNRVSQSWNDGFRFYSYSTIGQMDPTFDRNTFDRPGGTFVGYGVYWYVQSANVIPKTFGNITVFGNGTTRTYGLYFLYGATNGWTFSLSDILVTNSQYGLLLQQTGTINVDRSDFLTTNTAVECITCIARIEHTKIAPLSVVMGGANGEVTALNSFGSPRVQWQGDGGLLINSSNLFLRWYGGVNVQTLATIPMDFRGVVDNRSVPVWKFTNLKQELYDIYTPVYRQGSVDLDGIPINIDVNATFYGNITIMDPEFPEITFSTPSAGAQVRARTVTVKGTASDVTTGMGEVRVSVDLQTFSNVTWTDRAAGRWEVSLSFPDDGKYNISIRGWDRARWAITFGNLSSNYFQRQIVGVVIDTIAPAIRLDNPLTDITTNRSSIIIRGQATDANAFATFELTFNGRNLNATPNTIGDFNSSVANMSEGPNLITVIVTDLAGNTNVLSRTVTLDTIPPQLLIFTPAPNAYTNRGAVTVTGEVEEGVALYINGVSSPGGLPYGVVLNPGLNRIWINATDGGGNTASVLRLVTLDALAPTVTFTSPTRFPFAANSPRVIIEGRASEELSAVVLDNLSYPLLTPTTFRIELYLDDGTHVIDFRVTDLANNTADVSPAPVVIVDTVPPSVSVVSPKDGSIQSDRNVHICGVTDPNSGLNVTSPLGRFQISLSNPSTGQFCYDDTRTADGVYTYVFEATDGVGNTAAAEVRVTVDQTDPNVEVIGLATSSETKEDYVHLHGTVTYGTEVTVNTKPAAVKCTADVTLPCTFDMYLPVEEGTNQIVVVGTDPAGNTAVRNLFVKRTVESQVAPFDPSPLIIGAGLAAGLALMVLSFVQANRKAAEDNPGLKAPKKRTGAQPGSSEPQVIYEEDAQAMYHQDFTARKPPRPPR